MSPAGAKASAAIIELPRPFRVENSALLVARWPNVLAIARLAPLSCCDEAGATGLHTVGACLSRTLACLENCHDDVLDACKEQGTVIPFVLYDLRRAFATRAAQEGMPLPTLASVLGHASLRMVQKHGHPTQDHQQTEMDGIDKIRQENKRNYAELMRSQAHSRPTANGNSGDFHRPDGNGQETAQ
jgi:hypothetical protein